MEGVTLEKYQEDQPGFLRITAEPKKITVEYFVVPFSGAATSLFDTVTA